ncbi:hypothetical protein [Catenovulum sediminis]|uniref:hypothetical protein n=1 Tax=Catenovulum sediminis TaxID=1740262 RepID=UPI00117DD2B4|nr:hypothetical protein [Catenovulum sediminis]
MNVNPRNTAISYFVSLDMLTNTFFNEGRLALINASKTHTLTSFKIWYKNKWRNTEVRANPNNVYLKPNEQMSISFLCDFETRVKYLATFVDPNRPHTGLIEQKGEAMLCELKSFSINTQ